MARPSLQNLAFPITRRVTEAGTQITAWAKKTLRRHTLLRQRIAASYYQIEEIRQADIALQWSQPFQEQAEFEAYLLIKDFEEDKCWEEWPVRATWSGRIQLQQAPAPADNSDSSLGL